MSGEIKYVPAKTGKSYWVMEDRFTFLVTGAESEGSSFTMISDVAPHGEPPPHIHHLEDEQFYILDGELTFSVGTQAFQARTGDFIHIPRGTVHSFKNGPTPSRLLATFFPAGIEGFFKEVGEPVKDGSTHPPVTKGTIARFLAAEANGWRNHHETLLLPAHTEKS